MTLEYKSSTCTIIYCTGALIMDLFVVPLILMACWNEIIPKTFDYVHPLDYKGALLIRLTIYSCTAIFGSSTTNLDNDYQKEHYLKVICDSIKNKEFLVYSPDISMNKTSDNISTFGYPGIDIV